MSLSLRLRCYAEALDTLELMERRAADLAISPCRVHVSWESGSVLPGHDQLVRGIGEVATLRWREMCDEALAQQRRRVEALRIEAMDGRQALIGLDGTVTAGEPL